MRARPACASEGSAMSEPLRTGIADLRML